MTTMGLNYLIYEETKRSNLAREGENTRSNVAREKENFRSNVAGVFEQTRHNKATENLGWGQLQLGRKELTVKEGELKNRIAATKETVTANRNRESQMANELGEKAYQYDMNSLSAQTRAEGAANRQGFADLNKNLEIGYGVAREMPGWVPFLKMNLK